MTSRAGLPGHTHLGSFCTQKALKPLMSVCPLRLWPVSCSSLAASQTLAWVMRVPARMLFRVGEWRPVKAGYLLVQ